MQNEKIVLTWENLDKKDREILIDLYKNGADCAKFISRRFHMDLKEAMERLKNLEKLGFLKKIKGKFAVIRGKYKHMNHTYYELSRPAKLYLRKNLSKIV